MNRKTLFIILILFIIICGEAVVIFRQSQLIGHLEATRYFLSSGEVVEPVKLLGVNNERISLGNWSDSEVSLLFIFDRPGTACNQNLGYWKKLNRAVKGKVNVYGIVTGEYQDALSFFYKLRPGFNIYIPFNETEFSQKIRTHSSLSQTILIKGNKIIALKVGDLGDPGFLELVSTIRRHLDGGTV